MVSQLAELIEEVPFTGNTATDVVSLLTHHNCARTLAHSRQVAAEASRLAKRWGEDPIDAETAGWLHDVSAIVPPDHRIALAEAMQIDILPEERTFPMILHQKLSAAIAQDVFGITNPVVLSAIGCHTTLKANASPLDKILFVADKLKWDQEGDPPYLAALAAACEQSLDAAAFCYLDYLWQNRLTLPVLHPWMVAAYQQLLVLRLAIDLANGAKYSRFMTIRVNMHEAKSQLSKLVERALSGEDVIIARDGVPVVRLTPIGAGDTRRPEPGIDRGQVMIAPDFDEPIEEFEIL